MTTLVQRLTGRIKRLEEEFGSDNPVLKQLKQQLRAIKAYAGKSPHGVYRMQAFKFSRMDQAEKS